MDEKVASLQNDVSRILKEIKKLKEESITTTNNEKAINVLVSEYNNKLEEIKMLKAMNDEIYKEQLPEHREKIDWISSATSMVQPINLNGIAKNIPTKKSKWQF